jgi:hypothetical protein
LTDPYGSLVDLAVKRAEEIEKEEKGKAGKKERT